VSTSENEPIEPPKKECAEFPLTKQEDQLETPKSTEVVETTKTLITPKSDDSETQQVLKAEQDNREQRKSTETNN
jgi:hypothetical protein